MGGEKGERESGGGEEGRREDGTEEGKWARKRKQYSAANDGGRRQKNQVYLEERGDGGSSCPGQLLLSLMMETRCGARQSTD